MGKIKIIVPQTLVVCQTKSKYGLEIRQKYIRFKKVNLHKFWTCLFIYIVNCKFRRSRTALDVLVRYLIHYGHSINILKSMITAGDISQDAFFPSFPVGVLKLCLE